MKRINLPADLNLPPMRQLGIIVKSLADSLPFYTHVLNIKPWYRAEVVDSEIYYKEEKINLNLDIVVGYSGTLQFELIEVGAGDRNIYTDLMEKHGDGIHHIGFVVANIDKKTAAFQKHGFELLQYGTLTTKGKAITRFAYFDTIEYCGYITELIQTTVYGVNVGLSQFIMGVGTLLGDCQKIDVV